MPICLTRLLLLQTRTDGTGEADALVATAVVVGHPVGPGVLVLRLLPAYADHARFAAVCLQWRAAVRQPLPPPLPLLALPDSTFYSLPYYKSFHFPGFGFAGYESACDSWLVFPHDDGCFLVDPFSRATVTLPALSCVRLRSPNAVAKWSDSDDGTARFSEPYTTLMHINNEPNKLHISKLTMYSPNLVAALVGVGHTSQILMCQPGALSWSVRALTRTSLCWTSARTVAPVIPYCIQSFLMTTPRPKKRSTWLNHVGYC